MKRMNTHRSDLLQSLGVTAVAGAALGRHARAQTESATVKWSAGTARPTFQVPANATDCHLHIYDARFPWAAEVSHKPGDATVEDYRLLQRRLGTRRHVVVQPSSYGVDNRLLIESLQRFGEQARGVAVANDRVDDAELAALHAAGVRGLRFNLSTPGTTTFDMIGPLSKRIAALGWHVQVHATAAQIVEGKALWGALPCPVVFDHMGRIPQPAGANHPAFAVLCDLLQKDKAYVKLSGFYIESNDQSPTYADNVRKAKAFVAEAPERLVWGSNWPHPTQQSGRLPDDGLLFDRFAEAVGSAKTTSMILVDNPQRLYGF